MSVESRLREATSELDAALSRVAVPPMAESRRSRSPVAAGVGPAAVILLVVSLLIWVDTRDPVAAPPGTTTLTSGAVTTAPRTAAATTSPREMTGPIEVIDPSLARAGMLAELLFEPDSLGQEYGLARVDDPESVREWFQPIVWSNQDDWEWTIVGEVAFFDMPVVVGVSETDTVVCAGREPGQLSCAGEGFRANAPGQFSPAVWVVPESTAAVGFEEHDNSAWQLPSGGAVAFPRSHLSGTATLTAYDRDGVALASIVLEHIVETNPNFDRLPQEPMVDLMRALLDRGVPTMAGTRVVDHDSPAHVILGVATAVEVEFSHVDGSRSYAIIIGDGVRGVAIWSDDRAQLSLPLERVPSVEDHVEYVTVDLGDLIIVARGVPLEQVVEIWNSIVDDG